MCFGPFANSSVYNNKLVTLTIYTKITWKGNVLLTFDHNVFFNNTFTSLYIHEQFDGIVSDVL